MQDVSEVIVPEQNLPSLERVIAHGRTYPALFGNPEFGGWWLVSWLDRPVPEMLRLVVVSGRVATPVHDVGPDGQLLAEVAYAYPTGVREAFAYKSCQDHAWQQAPAGSRPQTQLTLMVQAPSRGVPSFPVPPPAPVFTPALLAPPSNEPPPEESGQADKDLVRIVREKLGYTQVELARAMGWTRVKVSHLETGNTHGLKRTEREALLRLLPQETQRTSPKYPMRQARSA